MFDACFAGISAWVGRRRRLAPMLLLLLIALALWRMPYLTLDNNIEDMLPASPAVIDDLRFLRQSGFAGQVILSISLPETQPDPARLIAVAQRLSSSLPGTWISEVVTGMPTGDLVADWEALLALTPQMIEPAQLEALQQELTPAEIDRRMGALYRRLLMPGSSMGRFLAADPLGIAGGVFAAIQDLTSAFGYRMKVSGGHLLSEDDRHVLLLLKTPVPVTDGFGARALLDHIDNSLAADPARPQALVVAGHRHTLSNETVIRRDVQRTGLAAALGFLVLLLGVFRDRRAGLIFLAPIGAIILSVALSSLLLGTLSYFMLGMSIVLAGIAMDYAIHVYVAKRLAGEALLRRVARPVTVGACTTSAVFVAFFFSSVPGYTQLACFSLISLALCLFLSLFLLPLGLQTAPGSWRKWRWTDRRPTGQRAQRVIVALWLVALTLLGLAATRLEFQRDVEQFDGSSEEVFEDERAFHRIWGGGEPPAMLVVESDDPQALWRRYETISQMAADTLGPDQVISLAPLWPSHATRLQRLERWRRFWSEQGPAIDAAMADARRKYGFSDAAFQPFLQWRNGADATDGLPAIGFLDGLKDRFVVTSGSRSWAIAYVDDTDANLRHLARLETRDGETNTRLVSRMALAGHISESIAAETGRLAMIAGILILIPVFLLMRNLRLGLLALTPVATALCAIIGLLPLLGLPLSAASLIAAMIVVGLVIDYGVYVVFDEHDRQSGDDGAQRSTVTAFAIHLSALTTLVGACALLLARHPVMFAIGVTLVTGVTAGYGCALWVTPTLCRLTDRRTRI